MIYDNVIALCNKKGINVSTLEKKAGLGNGTIAAWKESNPRIDNLQAVAKALGVSINKLIS